MTTPDLSALHGLSEAAFDSVLRRLTLAEMSALYDALATMQPADPRARLLWHAQKERKAKFMAQFNRLSVQEQGVAWLRLAAGDDLDAILNELPKSPAASDDDALGYALSRKRVRKRLEARLKVG